MQSEASQNTAKIQPESSQNVVGANNIQTLARPREVCGHLVIERVHRGSSSILKVTFFLGHSVYSPLYLSGSWRGHLNLFYLGKEWTGRGKAKILKTHLQWLSLAVDDRCPASYWGMRSDSTLRRVETLADYFLFQQNGFEMGLQRE